MKRAGRPIPTTLPAQFGGSEAMISVLHLVWSHVPLTSSASNGGHKRSEGNESGSVSRSISPAVHPSSPSMNSPSLPGTNSIQPICPMESTTAASIKDARRNTDHVPKVNITYRRHYQLAPPRLRRGKGGVHMAADSNEQMGALSSDGTIMAFNIATSEVIGSNMGAKLSPVLTKVLNEVHHMECPWSPRRQSERYRGPIFT